MRWMLPPNVRRFLTDYYVLTALVGLLWVTFVSDISLPYIVVSQMELNEMNDQIEVLDSNISTLEGQLDEWSQSEQALERYARETYFMKRPNEEVFRIIDPSGAPLLSKD